MKRCVFFDRDGIVNRSPPPEEYYVRDWSRFELLPEFPAVLRLVLMRGYEAVIVTNQAGIARGNVEAAAVETIHANLRTLLHDQYQLDLLDILHCPHAGDTCDCRKPKPGMLLEAARRHGLDLRASWMVGDQERDIEAGRAAGCRTILVAGGGAPTRAEFKVRDLIGLEALLKRVLAL